MERGTDVSVEKKKNLGIGASVPIRVRRAFKNINLSLCQWMIKYVAKNGKVLLVRYITEQASEMALGVTMAILDRERIVHCARCPQRFSLRKVGSSYLCLHHSQEERAKKAA